MFNAFMTSSGLNRGFSCTAKNPWPNPIKNNATFFRTRVVGIKNFFDKSFNSELISLNTKTRF